ncbi:MAG: thiamine-phosphate kinase [Candidatus Heimdallarchaeaceae archaeon]
MSPHNRESLKDLGERAFLKRIAHLIDDSILSFNEDASAIQLPSGKILVINVDMLVKETDVLPGTKYTQIGEKAVTMSVSDIVAKGVKPLGCLASVGLPSSMKLDHAQEIMEGIKSGCQSYDSIFLGGDLNQCNSVIVDIVSFGIGEKSEIVPRKGAEEGDLLFTTGSFGWTSLGFKILLDNLRTPAKLRKKAFSAVYEPKAKIEYLELFKLQSVKICMDSSDGLSPTLHELADINKLGINITTVPIELDLVLFAEKRALNPLDLAFSGGEEFELVFAISPQDKDYLIKSAEKLGLQLYQIGFFSSEIKGVQVSDPRFSCYPFDNKGYEHFH